MKHYLNLHLRDTQLLILNDNKSKAGVYMILNKINNKKYIGSAATNRIHVKFRNHVFHGTGSKNTAAAIAKYGIENFDFYILEYFPGFVKKENLSSAHLALLELETKYILDLRPEYNIHTDELTVETKAHAPTKAHAQTKAHARTDETKAHGGVAERRQLLSKIATLRNSNLDLRAKLSKLASKPVTLYNLDNSIHSTYPGIRVMAKAFNCCSKTINQAIKNQTVFRNIGIIK